MVLVCFRLPLCGVCVLECHGAVFVCFGECHGAVFVCFREYYGIVLDVLESAKV